MSEVRGYRNQSGETASILIDNPNLSEILVSVSVPSDLQGSDVAETVVDVVHELLSDYEYRRF